MCGGNKQKANTLGHSGVSIYNVCSLSSLVPVLMLTLSLGAPFSREMSRTEIHAGSGKGGGGRGPRG